MRKLVENFGSSGRANNPLPNIRLIDSGEINDATSKVLTPDAGGFYLIATKEWNASTGAYRGHRMHVVAVPEPDRFGSYACQRINTLHSDNYGVDITYNNDSTITLARSASTYAVRWAFYKLF